MKKYCFLALMIFPIFFFTSCQTQQDAEKDVKAIQTWAEKYMAAVKSADLEGLMGVQSEDVCFLPAHQLIVQGKEAARKWAKQLFDAFELEYNIELPYIEVLGDWAFARGVYNSKTKVKADGQIFEDTGKFINIFKKQSNGEWICSYSIWNSDKQ